MTVVFESERQLAAPRRLCPLPPVVGSPYGLETLCSGEDRDDHVPAFVRQARGLVERHPVSASALARLAQAELAWDSMDDAAASARAALKQSSSDPDLSVIVSAAVTLMACGEVTEAESALSGLPLEGPARVLYASAAAQRRDFEEAVRRLGDEENSPDAWNVRAWVSLNTGNIGAAVRAYRELLLQAGSSPATLTNLGLAYAHLGDLRRAISVTKQALRLAPSQRGRVGLNLAAYHLTCGEVDDALAVLGDLRRQRPHDIEPAFAEAGAFLAIGETESAQRVLRRARTSLWGYASDVQQAELTANIAFVQWHLGKQSRKQTADAVLRELTRTGYKSLRIAGMVPSLLSRFADVDKYRGVIAKLRTAQPDTLLYGLDVHLAVLERRFDEATTLAVDWARESPLDPDAATAATFLMADVRGDYDSAVQLGKQALRRTPAARRLANNVAYALALSGHPKDARRYLMDVDSPRHMATSALIHLVAGRVEEARSAYDRALGMALDADDPTLARLVRINAALAFSEFAPTEPFRLEEGDLVSEPDGDDPNLALAMFMAERRLGSMSKK